MTNTIGELPPAQWRRLNVLLAQVLDLEPAAREAWFAQLGADDAELLPLLRTLLAAAGDADAAPDSLAARLDFFRLGGPETLPTAGDRIGPYQLLRELGRGGMGVVWLAERVDGTIRRTVALKIPTIAWADARFADRLRRECAVLASLNHPNVAQLYDAGWSEGGLPWLAIEVVDGQPINRYCEEHGLDVRRRLRLFVDVLRAVAYAHARLIVHRDLKPANVLVDRAGQVKLLDFGIAKVLSDDDAAQGESDLTRVSGRPVTLTYAAPEQILGRRITTAADIYALGVMLFELLSGQRPFAPPGDTGSAIDEALARGDAPLPSAVASGPVLARALRGDLDRILGMALRKNPDERYETAAAFADDIERYLDGRAVRARNGGLWYRSGRFIARNRAAVAAGALVIVAVVGGLSVSLWQARRAELQAQNAAAIGSFVLSVIQQADPDAGQQTRASDLALLRTLQARIDETLGDRPQLSFALRLALGTAYSNRGEPREAAVMARLALRDAARAREIGELDVLRARVLLGSVSEDDHERSDTLDPSIERLRTLGRSAAPLLVDALLARTPFRRTRDPAANGDLREALEVARRDIGPGEEPTLKAANELAQALGPGVLEHNQEAADVLGPVLDAVHATGKLAPGNPALLRGKARYGEILCALNRCAEGVKLLDEVVRDATANHQEGKELRAAMLHLARGQRANGQNEAGLSTLLSVYALIASSEPFAGRLRFYYGGDVSYTLMQSRRPLQAEPFIDEAEVFLHSIPPADKAFAAQTDFDVSFRRLGTTLRLGEYERARALGESMLGRYRRDQSPYFEYVTNLFMGDVYLATGHPDAAVAAARAALQYTVDKGGPAQGSVTECGPLARALLASGDAAGALRVTEGIDDAPVASEASDPDLADFHLVRGRALLALHRPGEARAPLARAYEFWRQFAPSSHERDIASYWYARALAQNGEAPAAARLGAPPSQPLDYPPADVAGLREARRIPTAKRIAAVMARYPLRSDIAAVIARHAAAGAQKSAP